MMTNLAAVIAEIEPYSLSDDSIEKAMFDAAAHFGCFVSVDDYYSPANKQIIDLAAMICLNRLRVLSSENIGGISQSFDTRKLVDRIKSIAVNAGLSPNLVLGDSSEVLITYQSVW